MDIDIKIGDKTYTLGVTLDALEKIDARFGSIVEATQRVRLHDFNAICAIIAAGAGLARTQIRPLREEVFSAGLSTIVPQLADYIARLLNPNGAVELVEVAE